MSGVLLKFKKNCPLDKCVGGWGEKSMCQTEKYIAPRTGGRSQSFGPELVVIVLLLLLKIEPLEITSFFYNIFLFFSICSPLEAPVHVFLHLIFLFSTSSFQEYIVFSLPLMFWGFFYDLRFNLIHNYLIWGFLLRGLFY